MGEKETQYSLLLAGRVEGRVGGRVEGRVGGWVRNPLLLTCVGSVRPDIFSFIKEMISTIRGVRKKDRGRERILTQLHFSCLASLQSHCVSASPPLAVDIPSLPLHVCLQLL
jgi:hypothetical protein